MTHLLLRRKLSNRIIDELLKQKDKINGLGRDQVKNLLELATKQSFLMFNNKVYTQIDGGAMGSSLGPTLANSFLCYYESIWLRDCPEEFRPVY